MLPLLSLSLFIIGGQFIILLALIRTVKQAGREAERARVTFAARESELLDRIMFQAGQTWTPPPRPVIEDPEEDEELKQALLGWKEA